MIPGTGLGKLGCGTPDPTALEPESRTLKLVGLRGPGLVVVWDESGGVDRHQGSFLCISSPRGSEAWKEDS